MEVITADALISINATLFTQLLSFLIFVYFINRLMFKPLNGIIDERQQYMVDLKKSVIEAEEETERLTSQLIERETAAKNEAFKIKQELEEAGNAEASGIYDQASDEINTLKQKVGKQVNAEIEAARQSIETESEQLAVNIMEKILNRRLAA